MGQQVMHMTEISARRGLPRAVSHFTGKWEGLPIESHGRVISAQTLVTKTNVIERPGFT
jgi:hypothetical protein